jgi:hypothetical protein
MPEFLEEFDAKPLSGDEELTSSTSPKRFTVHDFWAWSSSDLLSNAKRGVFAEFIVAADFDVAGDVRAEWDAYDLTTKSGIKVEVKSAAYLQSWHQDELSSIGFSVAKSQAWDPSTNDFSVEKQRQADVYVFCLLKHQDMSTVNPLDMSQWEFYVVPTAKLNEQCGNLQRLSLKRLLDLNPEITRHGEILDAVEKVASASQ